MLVTYMALFHLVSNVRPCCALATIEPGTVLQQSAEDGCTQTHSEPEQPARIKGL